MKNFFIIHGSEDSSKDHWIPWMKSKVEEQGFECITPDFPCEDGHQLSRWYAELEKYKSKINDETIVIAHSRGVSFILNLLTDFEFKIETLYMIGGFIEYFWYPKKNGQIDTFFAKPFDIKKIKEQCKKFVVYQSNNDEYIPVEHGKKIAKTFNARYEFVEHAGHFSASSGYLQFEELYADVFQKTSNKIRILRENIDGYNYFQNTLNILSKEDLVMPNLLGNWTIKEIVAHLSGWETIVLREIDQILKNNMPETVGISDEEVDRINIDEVKKRDHLDFNETLNDWKVTFEKLHSKLENLSEEDFTKVVEEGIRKTSIKEIFDYRYEGLDHTSAHANQVRSYFRK